MAKTTEKAATTAANTVASTANTVADTAASTTDTVIDTAAKVGTIEVKAKEQEIKTITGTDFKT